MILWVILQISIPSDMSLGFGATHGSRRGGLLAVVVSTSRLGAAKLKQFKFAQVLPKRRVSVMIAVTTHDMCPVCFMVDGGFTSV